MSQGYGAGEALLQLLRIPFMILAGIAAFCIGFFGAPKKHRSW